MATDCTVIAMATSFVARLHEGPQLLYALLIGVSFHFLHENVTIAPARRTGRGGADLTAKFR